jgi:CRP-like cAMP-binding protein
MTQDLVGRDELPLTHDRLARMLGVRRVSVTLVLGAMVAAGLVGHSRGRLVIRSRSGLERASCECYQAMRDERLRLLGF